MRIGVDISLLQTAHRRRGIGYTLINFINHLPEKAKEQHEFVFYHYPIQQDNDPTELLDLNGVTFETRKIKPLKLHDTGNLGRFGLILGAINQVRIFRDVLFGDSRIKQVGDLDRFLQFDQNQPLPPRRSVRSTQIVYDLIPYVMKYDYLWTYSIARARGRSRKNSLRQQARRSAYYWRVRLTALRARRLLAISDHTRKDFVRYLHIRDSKITVCHLGVEECASVTPKLPKLKRYTNNGWGPIAQATTLPKKRYILFVGGADQRRKLVDLLAAFNMLRSQGEDIKLALVGDTMQGPECTPMEDLSSYFENTSYLDDIYFLGFVTDYQREWLYKNALAFVYPSVYEGFGLPVLEAMLHGTPVITYDNTSIREVAGEAAVYAHDYKTIFMAINILRNAGEHKKRCEQGISQAKKFSWSNTARNIAELVI